MVINKTPASTDFSNLPRAIVIFISAFDVFGDGELFYENVLVDKKTKKLRRRPVADFYVNTEHIEKGATDEKEEIRKIAALMKVFRDPDWYDEQFPAFSKRKKELHETEKGVEDVSKEIQMIIDEETEKNTEKMKNEFVDRLIALGKNTAEEISSLVGMPIDQVQQKMKRQYA